MTYQPDWTSISWRLRFSTILHKGLAPSTQRTYKSGKERYLKFVSSLVCQLCQHMKSLYGRLWHDWLMRTAPQKCICQLSTTCRLLQPCQTLSVGYRWQDFSMSCRGIRKGEVEKGAVPRECLPLTVSLPAPSHKGSM